MLHTILKLGTHLAVFTALESIPTSDEECSLQHFSAANAVRSVGLAMLIKAVYSIITHVL